METPAVELREGARPRKKNTRRWCKGIEGREHEYARHVKFDWQSCYWVVDKCKKCHRETNWRSEMKDGWDDNLVL